MELTWLGRSCFQLETAQHKRLLFDPYLEEYRKRRAAPFRRPDVICVSHGHPDHFADVPDLVRDDSPARVVAAPRLCRALKNLMPETHDRLYPLDWDDRLDLEASAFLAFRSPPMETSLYAMFEEFGVSKVLEFLRAFRQSADEILYLPLTSFGVEVDGVRLLHFVTEGRGAGEYVDVGDIGARFRPDVALVSVNPGEEASAAEYAAALGVGLVIPHHHRPYGGLPGANLDAFCAALHRARPASRVQVLAELEAIRV